MKPLRWRVPCKKQAIYLICNCKYTKSPPYCDGELISLFISGARIILHSITSVPTKACCVCLLLMRASPPNESLFFTIAIFFSLFHRLPSEFARVIVLRKWLSMKNDPWNGSFAFCSAHISSETKDLRFSPISPSLYSLGTHVNLPMNYLDRIERCEKGSAHHSNTPGEKNEKLCTGCGWVPEF